MLLSMQFPLRCMVVISVEFSVRSVLLSRIFCPLCALNKHKNVRSVFLISIEFSVRSVLLISIEFSVRSVLLISTVFCPLCVLRHRLS